MSELLTLQDLANGHLDVKALGEAANGDENTIVTTRTGNTYPSAERAINIMFQNGGLPATPYKNYDLMLLGSHSTGDYAYVINDVNIDNNGLYLKEETSWVKTKFNTEVRQVAEILLREKAIVSEVNPVFTTTKDAWVLNGSTIKKEASTRGYLLSSPIEVPPGKILEVESLGGVYLPVVEVTSSGSPIRHLGYIGDVKTSLIHTPVSSQTKYYSASGRPFTVRLLDGFTKEAAPTVSDSVLQFSEIPMHNMKSFQRVNSSKVINDSSMVTYRVPIYKGDTVKTSPDLRRYFLYFSNSSIEESSATTLNNPYVQSFKDGIYVSSYVGTLDISVPEGTRVLLNDVDILDVDSKEVFEGIYYTQPPSLSSDVAAAEGIHSSTEPFSVRAGDIVYISKPAPGTVVVSYFHSKLVGYTSAVSYPFNIPKSDVEPIAWVAPHDTNVYITAQTGSENRVYKNPASQHMPSDIAAIYNNLDKLKPLINFSGENYGIQNGSFRWDRTAGHRTNPSKDSIHFKVTKGDEISLDRMVLANSCILYMGEEQDILEEPQKYWSRDFSLNKYIAEYTGIAILVAPSKVRPLINGQEVEYLELLEGQEYYHKVAPYSFDNTQRTEEISLSKGDTIILEAVLPGTVTIVDVTPGEVAKVLRSTPFVRGTFPRERVEYTAPHDMVIRASSLKDSEITVKRVGDSFGSAIKSVVQKEVKTALKEVGGNSLEIPTNLDMPEIEYVFATAMNYILKLETKSDGIEYIAMSTDLGKTWNYTENIIGDIVQYHFFSDGTVMLCSPTKVWYSSDYQSFTESTVLDHDGSPFVPTGRHFFSQQNSDKVMIKDGQEMFVWGDYVVDSTPCRIWYTLDYGRTIKCAARFGVTPMDGKTRATRHVHRVNYRTKDGFFYITTGDAGSQCMVIKAAYDLEADTWSWNVLASGDEFKFGTIYFDDVFAYLVTDYTAAHLRDKKGIYRTPVHKIGDYSSYVPVYKADPAEWGSIALSRLIVDRDNGYMVLLPDYRGVGVIWVSKDGFNFKKVRITPSKFLGYAIGTNYNGDVYCVAYNSSSELGQNSELKLSRGSFNITKAIRDAGFPDFMRFNPLSMPSGSVTEQP